MADPWGNDPDRTTRNGDTRTMDQILAEIRAQILAEILAEILAGLEAS